MKRSIRIKWGKLQVGILILFAIMAVMWASFTGGGTSIFEPKKSFVSYFANVGGLITGSPVWVSGVEVGNVASVGFETVDSARMICVKCKIKRSVFEHLTCDARVQLGTIGFLGDKYIEVVPGPEGGIPLWEGAEIEVMDIGNAPAVFSAAEQALTDAGAVVSGLDTMLARMNRGEGTLGQLATDRELYSQLTRLLGNLTKLSADLQSNQQTLVSSLERMANSVADLGDKVNHNTGTIGRLMNDPALYDNLNATSARLDSILTRIDRSDGNVGLLVNDTTLYIEMANLLTRANNLIADIQKDPRKYFKFSVF